MKKTSQQRGGQTGLAGTTGSAHFVRLFKPSFAWLVEIGRKRQTIRPIPARMPKAGDTISLREWTGKPYRSKQRVLRESVITRVHHVDITETGVAVDSYAVPAQEVAEQDGFDDWDEMREWFDREHGLPFSGILICWQNK